MTNNINVAPWVAGALTCCGKRMRLGVADIGIAVAVGDWVWSADRYRCPCGRTAFGTPGREPIRRAADWPAHWRMQPVPFAPNG